MEQDTGDIGDIEKTKMHKKSIYNIKEGKYIIVIIILLLIALVTVTFKETLYNTNIIMSSISAYTQAICIVLQTALLIKQFNFTKIVEERNISENKGIFMLDKTNLNVESTEYEIHTNNRYNLRKGLSFHNKGNDNVILKSIVINSKEVGKGYNTFFTNQEEYSELVIDLELNDEELKEEEVNLIIELGLENLKGYNYIEVIEIVFKKEDKDSYIYNWDKFNIMIK